jgi:hypothetical protein
MILLNIVLILIILYHLLKSYSEKWNDIINDIIIHLIKKFPLFMSKIIPKNFIQTIQYKKKVKIIAVLRAKIKYFGKK